MPAPKTLVIGKDFDAAKAVSELSALDPKMGRLIERVGEFRLTPKRTGTPFHWLLRSIIYQQLHGKAAATIHGRVRTLFGRRDPEPEEVLACDHEALAAAGLSRNKLAAILDLARHSVDGRVPSRRAMAAMSDEEIIETLTDVRGVGRWTVEMLLIFNLGRLDVFAVDDYALRKSLMNLYRLKQEPRREELRELSLRWRPWRTLASWYLWRALDS